MRNMNKKRLFRLEILNRVSCLALDYNLSFCRGLEWSGCVIVRTDFVEDHAIGSAIRNLDRV